MRDKIQKLIISAIKELNDEIESNDLENPTLDTLIYGTNGNLDSLALVTLITIIEQGIADEFGQEIVLADEKAMSRNNSPFKSVQSLADYIVNLMIERA